MSLRLGIIQRDISAKLRQVLVLKGLDMLLSNMLDLRVRKKLLALHDFHQFGDVLSVYIHCFNFYLLHSVLGSSIHEELKAFFLRTADNLEHIGISECVSTVKPVVVGDLDSLLATILLVAVVQLNVVLLQTSEVDLDTFCASILLISSLNTSKSVRNEGLKTNF